MTYTGPIYEGETPRAGAVRRATYAAKAGVSFGSALAIAISWSVNQSIVWAIIHGLLSWLYVAWYALTR